AFDGQWESAIQRLLHAPYNGNVAARDFLLAFVGFGDTFALRHFCAVVGAGLPMQYRNLSERMKICPSLIAGEAEHKSCSLSPVAGSNSLFTATASNSGPGLTTCVTPKSSMK